MDDKKLLYEAAGVLEYWVVNPKSETIIIYHLENGKFDAGELFRGKPFPHIVSPEGKAPEIKQIAQSRLFPGLSISIPDMCAFAE
jgi:Uma2 family endonuclease